MKAKGPLVIPPLIDRTSPFNMKNVGDVSGDEFIKRINGGSPLWVWTSSALRLFRKCKRKFFWKYIMRLSPKVTPPALRIGTAFHEALAMWYLGASMKEIKKTLLDPQLAKIEDEGDLYDESEYDKLEQGFQILNGMLTGYTTYYAKDLKRWRLTKDTVEAPFSIFYQGMGFIYRGKIDGLPFNPKTDQFSVIEHKTAKTIKEGYIARLPVDTQTRSYIVGATKGLDASLKVKRPADIVYDITKKTQIRHKANETTKQFDERVMGIYLETPHEMFYRETLPIALVDVTIFEQELFATHEEFRRIINCPDPPPSNPRAWGINDGECESFFKPCTFLSVCTNCLNADNALSMTQRDSIHVELETAETEE